jgi:hypothetical protein
MLAKDCEKLWVAQENLVTVVSYMPIQISLITLEI